MPNGKKYDFSDFDTLGDTAEGGKKYDFSDFDAPIDVLTPPIVLQPAKPAGIDKTPEQLGFDFADTGTVGLPIISKPLTEEEKTDFKPLDHYINAEIEKKQADHTVVAASITPEQIQKADALLFEQKRVRLPAAEEEKLAEIRPFEEGKEAAMPGLEELRKKEKEEKEEGSYFLGTVRAVNEGTAGFFRDLDGAASVLSDVTGVGKSGLFENMAEYIETSAAKLPETPNTPIGNALQDVGHLEGLFLELVLTPEFRSARLAQMTKGAIKALPTNIAERIKLGDTFVIPKIVTQLGVSGFAGTYGAMHKTDATGTEKTVESFKAMGYGIKDGILLSFLGYGAGKASAAVKKATDSGLATWGTGLGVNAGGFGGLTAVESLITSGNINWEETRRAAVLGGALALPGLPNALLNRAFGNFFTASPVAIKMAKDIKKTPEELRDTSTELREKASTIADKQEKEKNLVQADFLDNTTDIKVISEDILSNPEKYIEAVHGNMELSEIEKTTIVKKINKFISEQDPDLQKNKPFFDELKRLKAKKDAIEKNEYLPDEAKKHKIEDIDLQIEKVSGQMKMPEKISEPPITEPLAEIKPEEKAAPAVEKSILTQETDYAERQKLINAVIEGDEILKTGSWQGRKFSKEELEAVKRANDKAKAKLGLTPEESISDLAEKETESLKNIENTTKALEELAKINPDIKERIGKTLGENVYHGTDIEFESFDVEKTKKWGKFGLWFANDKPSVEVFGKNIRTVIVDLKNPKIITAEKWNNIRDAHAKDEKWFKTWKQKLISQGYDGLKIEGGKEVFAGQEMIIPTTYAAFKNEQVREITTKNISKEYHKAKTEGSNPELVKAVEEAISKKSEKPSEKITPPTEPEKKDLPEFKEHITTGTKEQKGKYQVEKVGDEVKILNVDSGKYVKPTKQNQWVIDQYVDANIENFRAGKEAEIPEGINPDEVTDFVIENSKNPAEIATAWINSKETKDVGAITFEEAVYEVARDIDPVDFAKTVGYGPKNAPHLLSRFKKGGVSLDVIRERVAEQLELSEEQAEYFEKQPTKEAEPIQRIVDLLTSPKFKDYKPKKETITEINLAEKFKSITGLDLTFETAKKVTDYRDKLEKWADKIDEFIEEIPEVGLSFFMAPRLLKFALQTVSKALRAGSDLSRAIKLAIIKTKEIMKKGEEFDEDEFRKLIRERRMIIPKRELKKEEEPKKKEKPFEREVGKKAVLGRAFESRMAEEKPEVKKAIENYELTYQEETHEKAKESAIKIIENIGFDKALELVRNNKIEDGAAPFVWGAIIDNVRLQLDATKEPAEITRLTDLQAQLKNELDIKARSWGRGISALQAVYELYDFSYNLTSQIEKYKEANEGVIPAAVEAKFREYDKQLKETITKLHETEEKLKGAEETIENIKSFVQWEKEHPKRERPVKRGKALIAEGTEDLAAALGIVKFAVGEKKPDISKALAKIGRGLIDEGIATAENVIQKIKEYIDIKFKGKIDFSKYEKDVKRQLEGERTEGKIKIPHSLIRDFVEKGIDNIKDLTKAVQEAIKEEYPDATEREVRDAITGYGKTVTMDKEQINVQIRKMKRIGKLISGIEDVQNKKRPLRSGLQRDKLDAEERALGRELKELMKDLPVDEAEIEKKWKSALDAIKTRLKNSIEDLERRIETGEKPSAKKQVEWDAEAKALAEERDRLKKIVEELEGKTELTDEQRAKLAIRGVERNIADLERKIRERELETPKGKLIPQTPELKTAKERREALKTELQKLQQEAGIPERKRLEAFKKRTIEQTKILEERIRKGDFMPKRKKPLLKMDDEAIRLKAEKNKIKEKFDLEHEKLKLSQRPKWQKFWDVAADVILNVPKAMRASLDMSAPLRQGIIFTSRIITRPRQTASEFKHMFKVAFSEKKADDWLRYIKASDEYATMKASGLFLAEPTAKLSAREEVYRTNMASKIPIYKYLYNASQRAYTSFLNKQRVDAFLDFQEKMKRQGITYETDPEILKSWANFVNNATGRGNMGQFEQAAEKLNNVFFSPRLIAARFNLINPITYAKMPKEVRKEALKSMAEFIGIGTTVLFMASMAGADVEYDPRSSDFGKIRIGDTRIDIWGGFVQWIRLSGQLLSGQRKSTATGEITILGEGYGADSRSDVLFNFFKNKLSPTPAFMLKAVEGKTAIGDDVDLADEFTDLAIPLYLSDIDELRKEEKLSEQEVIGLIGLSFFGVGIQQYGMSEMKTKEIMEKRSKRSKGKLTPEEKEEKEKKKEESKLIKQKKEEQLKSAAKKHGIKYIAPKSKKAKSIYGSPSY